MTQQQINEAVAKKLGYKKFHQEVEDGDGYDYWSDGKHQNKNDLDFSTSIEAAWEIWEKMSNKYFLTLETEAGKFGRNIVKIWENDGKSARWVIEDIYEDTATLAICKAFLKLEG